MSNVNHWAPVVLLSRFLGDVMIVMTTIRTKITDHGECVDASGSKGGCGARQFLGAARADGDLRSHFAQGRGDLQAETARAAGDERDLIPKLE
jgi:hypothetical protein